MAIERRTRLLTKVVSVAIGVSALTMCMSAYAAASGEAHHEPSISQIAQYWINFVIYIVLLYLALRTTIRGAWAVRRDQIKTSVRQSVADLDKAEEELRSAENLSRTVAAAENSAREEIHRQAEAEAEALIVAAREKADRIRAQAEELILAENRTAEVTLRDELIARAVDIAKERFKAGDLANRQNAYVDAAISRARRLVQ
jgi:F0F1-type ATP synthase membrane subunit b/b'